MSADMLERVRMAVAEAGYDPTLVGEPTLGYAEFSYDVRLPETVAWRAFESALVGKPTCHACSTWSTDVAQATGSHPLHICLADRRFVEDCGVERPS